MNGCNVIRLEVPGRIECRDMVLRTVSAACKLVTPDGPYAPVALRRVHRHRSCPPSVKHTTMSSCMDTLGASPVRLQIQIENCHEWMRVMIKDTGMSFDPAQASPPDLEALPESGLGIFIMRSFVDEVTYLPGSAGSPNVLTLFKRLDENPQMGMNTNRSCQPKAG
jgi:serine/threonine-protein kinase RsbW